MNQYIDYSNYDKDHPNYNVTNKAKLGYFKNEFAGKKKCIEFIGLRPKCYSLNLVDLKSNEVSEKHCAKGLGKCAIKNRLKFKQYKKCLFKGKIQRHDFASIRSTKHKISTIMQRKKCLSHFDSKRWLFSCGIHSSPYGSKLITKYYDKCPFC